MARSFKITDLSVLCKNGSKNNEKQRMFFMVYKNITISITDVQTEEAQFYYSMITQLTKTNNWGAERIYDDPTKEFYKLY